jgi:STE24 endopeptidase
MGFLLSLILLEGPAPVASAYLTLPVVVIYLLGVAGLGYANTARFLRSIGDSEKELSRAMKRYHRMGFLVRGWVLVGQAGVILLGYGNFITEQLHLQKIPLVSEVMVLCPFIVGLLLMWIFEYPYHCAIRCPGAAQKFQQRKDKGAESPGIGHPRWTRWEYVAYNTRHYLLFLAVPVALIILIGDTLLLLSEWLDWGGVGQYILPGGMLITLPAVFLLAPVLIVRIWQTHPLGAGDLRETLEATCRKLSLKYREIRIWRSSGMIANAGVMGLVGPLRYILLSDALVEQMDRRDIEAIFAHEAAHIMHHHIFYAAMFAVGSVGVCFSGAVVAVAVLNWPQWAVNALSMGLLGVFWGFVFGYVSRRFERQCDVMGAWASGPRESQDDPDLITHEGAAAFAHALRRVGEMNGISPGQRNWRHGSIAKRISYVLWLGSTGGTRRVDDRAVLRIKRMLWVLALVGLVAGAWAMILVIHL